MNEIELMVKEERVRLWESFGMVVSKERLLDRICERNGGCV
jgi:hypothetical protein